MKWQHVTISNVFADAPSAKTFDPPLDFATSVITKKRLKSAAISK
jgi:hypothetical protein